MERPLIQGPDWERFPCTLRKRWPEADYQPVQVGERLVRKNRCGDDEVWIVEGGRPPHKAGSTGRIWVRQVLPGGDTTGEQQFYPGVLALEWVRDGSL